MWGGLEVCTVHMEGTQIEEAISEAREARFGTVSFSGFTGKHLGVGTGSSHSALEA